MIAEVGIKILWNNYTYDFGGKTYKQEEGGPIGQRPTMAASRLVMEEFFTDYQNILTKAGVKTTMMRVYVDDGRQITTLLRKGMRFKKEKMEFEWDMYAEEEDEMLEKSGEDRDSFMARLCLPAMNAVNRDLTFTAEVASDFVDKRLPTLDFSLWMKDEEEVTQVTHCYYEKEMKTQQLLEKDSAMAMKQKFTILSNELTRRLYNIDDEGEHLGEEVDKTIEHMTK